ncbi:unnamed protein product [Lampetra fluviatilis]
MQQQQQHLQQQQLDLQQQQQGQQRSRHADRATDILTGAATECAVVDQPRAPQLSTRETWSGGRGGGARRLLRVAHLALVIIAEMRGSVTMCALGSQPHLCLRLSGT